MTHPRTYRILSWLGDLPWYLFIYGLAWLVVIELPKAILPATWMSYYLPLLLLGVFSLHTSYLRDTLSTLDSSPCSQEYYTKRRRKAWVEYGIICVGCYLAGVLFWLGC